MIRALTDTIEKVSLAKVFVESMNRSARCVSVNGELLGRDEQQVQMWSVSSARNREAGLERNTFLSGGVSTTFGQNRQLVPIRPDFGVGSQLDKSIGTLNRDFALPKPDGNLQSGRPRPSHFSDSGGTRGRSRPTHAVSSSSNVIPCTLQPLSSFASKHLELPF
jgi:hypothetical protein